MRDPYLHDQFPIIKNLLGITDQDTLDEAEADYVSYRLRQLAEQPLDGKYDYAHFMAMHRCIFQDLYEWAGQLRIIGIFKEEPVLGGLSVEYSSPEKIRPDTQKCLQEMRNKPWDEMNLDVLAAEFSASLAKLWKIHCFREGNTRTVITFCCQFADQHGISLTRELFEKHSRYVRTALVAYNAYFADGSDFSKKDYLVKIVRDSLL